MRTFLLAAVILQLLLLTSVLGSPVRLAPQKFTFGDIIAFPKGIFCNCTTTVNYKHYAIYVGNRTIENITRRADEDIFEFTGPVRHGVANCVFSKLSPTMRHFKDNYMDHYGLSKASDESIMNGIREKHLKCGIWKPFSSNCEHVATYLRYGKSMSLQLGTDAAEFVWNGPNKDRNGTKEILAERAAFKNANKGGTTSKVCDQQNFEVKVKDGHGGGKYKETLDKLRKVEGIVENTGICKMLCHDWKG